MASKRNITFLKWKSQWKKGTIKGSCGLSENLSHASDASTLLTIRMSVLTTTVECPIKYHQKIFQIILEGVFEDVTVFIGSLINPLSALTLCLADTVQLLDKFR